MDAPVNPYNPVDPDPDPGPDPVDPDPAHPVDGPLHRISRGLTDLSHNIRRTITFASPPGSPTRSEWDLESGPSTPGLEKLRRWSTIGTIRKSMDTSNLKTPSTPPPPSPRPAPTLMNIPPELQLMVLRFLNFGDIELLRRTCRFWYNFATPKLVKSLWGPDTFQAMLISHCRVCLTWCPGDLTRLHTTRLDAGFPLSARCVPCTVQSGDGTVKIGKKITLGNFTDYWICRWCGWPITSNASTSHVQFHRHCYDRYAFVLLAFFALGWLQFFIGIIGAALAWRYFRNEPLVFAPTVTGFLLMWICIIVIMFRGNKVRTYHWALLMELGIVGMWIPPVYRLAQDFVRGTPSKAEQTTLAFFGLNILFRLFNIIGNIILVCEYDRTRHYVPRVPWWRRFANPIMTAFIFWTYPQTVERKNPPDWH